MQQIPAELKTWLYASGSLTQQLTQTAGGQFRVEPLQEYFQRLSFVDAQWMQMPYHHTSWVRESYLYGCDEQPWVQAKSIFPISSLQGRARRFKHIGRMPIGKLLFQRTTPTCMGRLGTRYLSSVKNNSVLSNAFCTQGRYVAKNQWPL